MHGNKLPSTVLLLVLSVAIAGCGKDEPEPPKENFGGGLGKSYNEMLDQAKDSVDAANQRTQDTEQRIREAR